jgi:acetyltransferase-like isoleucine patch superfamily enzyme
LLTQLRTLFAGLRVLRHRELVRRLGDVLAEEQDLEQLRRRFPEARIASGVIAEGWREAKVDLAAGAIFERGTILAFGDSHNGYGSLSVGERSWVGQYNNFRLAGGEIRIGADCMVSQFCTLVAANHQLSRSTKLNALPSRSERNGVTLGDDVWIGANSVLLPGTSIAHGAVIGAGSIVSGAVGPWEIWAGNPARKIGERPA